MISQAPDPEKHEPVDKVAGKLELVKRASVPNRPPCRFRRSQSHRASGSRIYPYQVHQRQVAPELVATVDSFVIVEEIPTSIKDQTLPVDLDGFDVMGRVAMHNIDAAVIDKSMGEVNLCLGIS